MTDRNEQIEKALHGVLNAMDHQGDADTAGYRSVVADARAALALPAAAPPPDIAAIDELIRNVAEDGTSLSMAGEELRAAVRALAGARPEGLSFADALRIARGCTDYGGGHRGDDEHFAIYQHGIQTVINSLTSAGERGMSDSQVKALHRMGAPAPAGKEPTDG